MTPQLGIFVPAVLSIGLVLSLATLVRDAIRRLRGQQWLARRAALDGRNLAVLAVRGDERAARTDGFGRRHRSVYGAVGVACLGLAGYLLVGSYGNYVGWTGWVKTIGWIWLVYLVFIALFGFVGASSLILALRSDAPPAWTRPLLAHTPLSPVGAGHTGPVRRRLRIAGAAPRRRPGGPEQIDARAASVMRTVASLWTMVAVVVLSLLALQDRLPQAPDPGILETAITGPAQIALLAIVTIGSLIAGRHEAVGAAVMAAAGSALAFMSAVQYPPWVAVCIAVAFGTPAFLHWVAWQRDRHLHHLVALALATSVLFVAVGVGADTLYDKVLGPSHPESTVASPSRPGVDWVWAGGTTGRSTVVAAKISRGHQQVRLAVSEGPVTTDRRVATVAGDQVTDEIVRFSVEGLEPGHEYAYGIELDGRLDATDGTFRTFPEGPASFRIAFGSCSRTGSNGQVFDAIERQDPLLYVEVGDLSYVNVRGDDLPRFLRAYDATLEAPAQATLYRSTSTYYVWDDHDFGGNDADRNSASRSAAQTAFRLAVPHQPLPAPEGDGAIYQSFTTGRVRVVITDLRSHRDPEADGRGGKALMGATQLAWFEGELRAAAAEGQAIVWVSSSPWIDAAALEGDSWGGYADERQHIAGVVRTLHLQDRMLMIAGDAHLAAFDDGSHAAYDGEGSGFPVVIAGALDRPGGAKGGPYTDGPFPGGGHFGTLDVQDDGGQDMTITFKAHTWDGRVLIDRTVPLSLA